MKRRYKLFLKIKYLVMVLIILLLGSIVLTYMKGGTIAKYKNFAVSAFTPVRSVFSSATGYFKSIQDTRQDKSDLEAEIEELKAENEEYRKKLEQYNTDRSELNELRELLKLSDKYYDYPTTGAKVIGKKSGNWFYEFTIDKGSDDGIKIDMNVLAAGGLAGIVTDVGKNYAVVTSIIADDMNVSAVSSTTRDNCIVSGDLELISDGYIRIMHLSKNADVKNYDRLVTATTSSKYLPGILIGYSYDITEDSNNLTKSGLLVPAVNFEHMENVLVILKTKAELADED